MNEKLYCKREKGQKDFREQLGAVDTMNRKWIGKEFFFSMIPLNVDELGRRHHLDKQRNANCLDLE